MAVCLCTDCVIAGAGRVARALAREFGTEMGRRPLAGGVALERVPSHVPGTASPLVTLDGKVQAVSPSGAAAWARGVAGRNVA